MNASSPQKVELPLNDHYLALDLNRSGDSLTDIDYFGFGSELGGGVGHSSLSWDRTITFKQVKAGAIKTWIIIKIVVTIGGLIMFITFIMGIS